jgi:23S rRNA (guanosine2251-2'-O)-methyltransferase
MSRKVLSICSHSTNHSTCINEDRFPIYIILENIRSLYNVGAIFRTADAARIKKVFLCGITGHPPNNQISKTALGAQDSVPWEYHADSHELIVSLKKDGVRVIAIEQTEQKKSIWTQKLISPVCFIFGYEIEGIAQETLDLCDDALEIPMFGFKGSLNVSIACGIVIFEALRQINNLNDKSVYKA